ncbi:MAG TPA: metallophosphoesterase [Patescibacteria group bacterium]|nr:metallophosphoesterase [Patescibacteria group bacterium]
MSPKEILEFCLEKGLLLDSEVLKLFSEISDINSVKLIIERIKNQTQERVITKKIFSGNQEFEKLFLSLPKENQKSLETLKIKLGLSIEISREKETEKTIEEIERADNGIKVLSRIPVSTSKPEVSHFVKYFRNRFNEMRNILQGNPKLTNLVSINKLSRNRQIFSVIGMVSDKRTTKNKNIILELEDLGGKIKVLINSNKEELFKEGEDISLDSVIGVRGTGDNNIIFANEIVFPDSLLYERKRSPADERALFLGDLHFGSKLFLEKSFLKFIDYLNGKVPDSESEKIKYLFLVGDIVTGVGNYPTQEKDLKILNLEEQFSKLAELLGRIRKDITIIISPGNHDGVRMMEPQPLLDEKYAWQIYNLKNVILTGNPAHIKMGERKDFSGFDVLTYHGFSFPFYADNVPKLMHAKAMNAPDKIMSYLLKNRHLAPTHTSIQYFPFDEDYLIIKKIPDIFVSAHTHKSAVSYYNNILLISVGTWEAKTAYQEKMGNEPDFCKVPMFNLKTREVKILDFEEKENE